jgi:hypothetical protein
VLGGILRRGAVELELLSDGLLVGFAGPALGGLGLIAEDEVELIFVAWADTAGFGTLVARWLCFVALERKSEK